MFMSKLKYQEIIRNHRAKTTHTSLNFQTTLFK